MAAVSKGWGKLSGALEAYANANKDTMLLGKIQQHMMKEHAKPSTRRQDVVHPSEMAKGDWCPRSTYLRIAACREASNPFLKPAEFVGVQLLNIFDEGHAIHDKWQRRLRDMGFLWGNWECRVCGYVTKSHLYDPKQRCEYCDRTGAIDVYREVPLKLDKYLIAGHADGAIPSLDALIEIKSVGVGTARIEAPDIFAANSEGQKVDLQGLWAAIKEPFPSHIRQGQLYLRLCSEMGFPFKRIIFLYESKFNQGAKEFVVEYDPRFCDEMFELCESIWIGLETGIAPPCITGSSCKECEKYGTQTSDINRVGNTTGQSGPERTDSTRKTIRRNPSTSSRIVRPS